MLQTAGKRVKMFRFDVYQNNLWFVGTSLLFRFNYWNRLLHKTFFSSFVHVSFSQKYDLFCLKLTKLRTFRKHNATVPTDKVIFSLQNISFVLEIARISDLSFYFHYSRTDHNPRYAFQLYFLVNNSQSNIEWYILYLVFSI